MAAIRTRVGTHKTQHNCLALTPFGICENDLDTSQKYILIFEKLRGKMSISLTAVFLMDKSSAFL